MTRSKKFKDYDVPHILAAKELISKDPRKHHSIEALAEKVGINEFKLKKGFVALMKTTPNQFRLNLLLLQAKEMLEDTDNTINEIAIKMGFDSRDGFSRAFKRQYHQSPQQWRNKLNNEVVTS
jgi:AraC-like DNA-binding protein